MQTADARKDVSSGFLSSKTTIDRTSTDDRSAQATTVSGNTVTAVEEQHSSTQFHSEKESGMFSGGGIAVILGSRSEKQTGDGQGTTLASSSVGSVAGNVNLLAGTAYQQTASSVLAPAGDVSITAPKVNISAGMETNQYTQTYEAKQSGVTLSITSPILSVVQMAETMSKAASQTSDPRMQALAAASVALNVKNNAADIANEAQTLSNGDTTTGLKISISIGSSQSKSDSTQLSSKAVASKVGAGNNATLGATGIVNLQAAANTDSTQSSNSGSSASLGIGFALGSQNGFLSRRAQAGAREAQTVQIPPIPTPRSRLGTPRP